MIDMIVSALTCVLAGIALGYCEVRAWTGIVRWFTYAAVSLIVAELGAEPLLWQLLRLPAGWVETMAIAIASMAALLVMVNTGKAWVR